MSDIPEIRMTEDRASILITNNNVPQVMGPQLPLSLMGELRELEKLDEHNYVTWSADVQSILDSYDCLQFLLETHDTNQLESNRTERVRHSTTRRFLLRAMQEPIRDIVNSYSWSWEIWEELKSKFTLKRAEKCSQNGIETLEKSYKIWTEMTNMKMREGDEFIKHLSRAQKTFKKLRDDGCKFPEIYELSHLLRTLPPSYDTIRVALEALPNEYMTYDYVVNKLIEFSIDRKTKKKAHEQSTYRKKYSK